METACPTDILCIDDYPELALVAWNRAVRHIAGDEALALYESNWRFIDRNAMTPKESALVERLVHQYGHGLLHV